jgi:hypothetical protein
MSLVEQDDYNGLKVCKRCGWTEDWYLEHETKCVGDLELDGKAATKLANSIPNVESTKLGYGTGKLTFNFDGEFSVTLRCGEKSFAFDHVFLLGDMTEDAARDLVQTLAAWRARRK